MRKECISSIRRHAKRHCIALNHKKECLDPTLGCELRILYQSVIINMCLYGTGGCSFTRNTSVQHQAGWQVECMIEWVIMTHFKFTHSWNFLNQSTMPFVAPILSIYIYIAVCVVCLSVTTPLESMSQINS